MQVLTPSLLITDDDRDFRETLGGVFEARGFRTLLAGDGEEALELLGHEHVHVLLVDMHMPRLSGLETIRRLHDMRLTLPCILLSAALDEAIEQQARAAAAYDVRSKPIRLADITGIVGRAMQQFYNWAPRAG